MSQSTRIPAIYQGGVLTLLEPLDLPEGAHVQVDVHASESGSDVAVPLIPARKLDALTGLMAVGGDALADSEALY